MILTKNELETHDFTKALINKNERINYDDMEVKDALIEKINYADVDCCVLAVDNDEVFLTVKYKANVIYLDARTLEKLTVNFEYSTEVEFTSDKDKAEELEIDFYEEEIDISRLVFELLMVNLPINYSESKPGKFFDENQEEPQNKPFEDVFKRKE